MVHVEGKLDMDLRIVRPAELSVLCDEWWTRLTVVVNTMVALRGVPIRF
jgi:hypothetical protein